MNLPRTLGQLRSSPFSEPRLNSRRVKDEMRENLIGRLRLRQSETLFPGIVGYDDPSPWPNKMERLSTNEFATARSLSPSLLKSPRAIDWGTRPTG